MKPLITEFQALDTGDVITGSHLRGNKKLNNCNGCLNVDNDLKFCLLLAVVCFAMHKGTINHWIKFNFIFA